MIVFSSSETPETFNNSVVIASGESIVHHAPPAKAMM
jgi:hypothetical protein